MKLDRIFLLGGICLIAVVLVAADSVQAQGRGGFGGGRGGWGAMGQQFQMMGLLRNEDVAKDLELTDEQLQKFDDLQQDMRSSMRDMFRDLRELNEEERVEKIQEYMDDYKSEVNRILLPHQSKRLSQINLQRTMSSTRGRGNGALALLQNKELVEKLGITEEQIEDMQKKSEEVAEEVRKKIERIQKEAQEEVLGVLSKSQRKELEEMMGETFKFSERRDRGRGDRGDRGDRGGDRRGGRDDG